MKPPAETPKLCAHLQPALRDLLARGARITFAGQAWSQNCRLWVYFDLELDLADLRKRHALAACVINHEHAGTHDGRERGLVCCRCHDAVMGLFPPA
ncbi:MAG: hypothetical protein KIS67_19730 [Verrucomicrobiae bacterium]|nr:hypothetical protein [Verrucomicrobiae bacterium]